MHDSLASFANMAVRRTWISIPSKMALEWLHWCVPVSVGILTQWTCCWRKGQTQLFQTAVVSIHSTVLCGERYGRCIIHCTSTCRSCYTCLMQWSSHLTEHEVCESYTVKESFPDLYCGPMGKKHITPSGTYCKLSMCTWTLCLSTKNYTL